MSMPIFPSNALYVGDWCYQKCKKCGEHSICEHNLVDASRNPAFVCAISDREVCNKGNKFSHNCDKKKLEWLDYIGREENE